MRFPGISEKLGLGVGLDLPWGADIGFVCSPEGDAPEPRVLRFFECYAPELSYYFFSFQPKARNRLRASDYIPAFDRLVAGVPIGTRSLHHTVCNLGAMEPYDRQAVIDFTNELVDRYDLKWINEDLGIWSIEGKTMPYPLPPLLTKDSLRRCIENVAEYQRGLTVPLLVEFPGFSEGTNFYIGRMDGFEFFSHVVRETGSPCTIDTGHVLSYVWLQGRNEVTDEDLARLPLDHCFEIHLSGCQIVNGRFMDFHHGILMDEQLSLLETLLERCPRVRAITYEDPKFDKDGRLIPKSEPNYRRLARRVGQWMN